jgi:alpha-aminoadipate carrier protein LysW
MKKIICPDCKQPIPLEGEVIVGDVLECPNCATELEIVGKDPIKVEIIEEEK